MAEKRYAKPKGADSLPGWFKQIRSGANFMPAKIKPYSYNYMAMMESPSRKGVYAPPSSSPAKTVQSPINIGQFNRPTEKVAKGIGINYNLIRDQHNMGIEPLKQPEGFFQRFVDVISRPLYAVANAHLDNTQRHYMGANSAGGERVTLGEHFRAIASGVANLTPFGVGSQMAAGTFDDRIAATWRGLSGKEKTTTGTVLEKEYPGFSEEHPALKMAASILGDVVFDPLTWVTAGATGPGTVLKSVGAASLGAAGKKSAAKALLQETLLTPTGVKAAKETLRLDRFNAELRRLGRQERSLNKMAASAAKGKKTKLLEQEAKYQRGIVLNKMSDLTVDDIKGADFAWRVIRNGLPLAGLNTISKANMGASAWRKVEAGSDLVKTAHTNLIDGVVDTYKDDEKWKALHTSMRGEDLTYSHGGKNYTVKLSEAKNPEEWLRMIFTEGAPVAKIAEHNVTAGRSRKARIINTETRGRAFQAALKRKFDTKVGDALSPDAAKAFDEIRASDDYKGFSTKEATQADMDNPKNIVIDENELSTTSHADLKQRVADAAGESYRDGSAQVIVKSSDDVAHFVSLRALNTRAKGLERMRRTRLEAIEKVRKAAPAQRAADAASGVRSSVAEAREVAQQAYMNASEARKSAVNDVNAASNNQTDVATKIWSKLDDIINSDEYSDAEKAVLTNILGDTSKPPLERVKELLTSMKISHADFMEVIEDVSQFKVVNNQLHAVVKGSGPEIADLNKIINEVLAHRLESRVGPLNANTPETISPMYKAAGIRALRDLDGNVTLESLPEGLKGSKSINHLKDLQGELGLMVLDSWRLAIDYAVKTNLMKDPENVFLAIAESTDVFLNQEFADIKRQAIQLMYNISGIRLPEEFVPKVSELGIILPGPGKPAGYLFKPPAGSKKRINQEIPWQNLAMDMQKWVGDLFAFLPEKSLGVAKGGFDVPDMVGQIFTTANKVVNIVDPKHAQTLIRLDRAIPLLEEAALTARVGDVDIANTYSILDFLLHGKQILKSQETFTHIAAQGEKYAARINAGRLSAVDSFTFVDPKTQKALEALEELKRLAKSSTTDAPLRDAAQQRLSALFIKHGGLDHLNDIRMPASENLKDINFTKSFSTLGIHARLKEEVSAAGYSLQTKHRADLMDEMWGKLTVNHEWQKALHNTILYKNIVDGQTQEQIAEVLAKNIEEFFDGYEKIKRLIHPIKSTGEEFAPSTLKKYSGAVKKNFGRNQFNPEQNVTFKQRGEVNFNYPVDVEGLTPTGKPYQGLGMTPLRNKLDADIATEGIDMADRKKLVTNARKAWDIEGEDGVKHGILIEDKNKNYWMVTRDQPDRPLKNIVQLGAGTSHMDVFTKKINPSYERFMSKIVASQHIPGASISSKAKVSQRAAKEPELAASEDDVNRMASLVGAEDKSITAQDAETAAMNAWEDALKDSTGPRQIKGESNPDDPADFPNVAEEITDYTPEELERIKAWIASSYANHTPQKLAMEMNGLSNALSSDVMLAQSRIVTGMEEFNITHKANLRVMGVPLMNLPNLMNGTHAQAAVTVLEKQRASASNFFRRNLDPNLNTGARRAAMLKYRSQSQVINAGLDNVRMYVANAATVYRGDAIRSLNNMYKNLRRGEYSDAVLNTMNTRQLGRRLTNQLFNPNIPKIPGALKQFDLVDGTNPVFEIQQDFMQVATRAFDVELIKREPASLPEQLRNFNRYMNKKFKLEETDINSISTANIDPELTPYSLEWLKEAGKVISPDHPLNSDNLVNIKLGEFHYAIHDSWVRMDSGSKLHHNAWAEFASIMRPRDASYYNDTIVPSTLGSDGETMRKPLIKVSELITKTNKYGFNSKHVPAKYIEGDYYVSEDFVPELKTLFQYMDMSHELNDEINIQMLDKVLNYFKASVTIYNVPTYPVRNLISDVFMSAMDGLVNPRYYSDATKIMWKVRQDMKDMNPADYQEILDKNFMAGEMARAQADPASVMDPAVNPPDDVVLRLETREGRQELSTEQIYHAYSQLGLNQNRVSSNIAESVEAARETKIGLAGGKAGDQLRTLNDVREDWGRMAHFLYALEREAPLGGGFEDVLRRAGDRVKKYHFDYSDVSLFERKVLARWIPFYKWVRNVIPFTISNAILKPKFVNIERAISEQTGNAINSDREEGEDFILADFIKHDIPVPIGIWSDPNGNKFQQFALMYLPLGDTLTETLSPTLDPLFNQNISMGEKAIQSGEGFLRTSASMMNPIFKSFLQGATNTIPFGSSPKQEDPDENWAKSLGQMIPGWVPAGNAIEQLQTIKGGAGQGEGDNSRNKVAELAKMLGAMRVYDNSETSQLGQLHRNEDMHRGNINKRKAELAALAKQKYPHLTDEQVTLLIDEALKQSRKADSARL